MSHAYLFRECCGAGSTRLRHHGTCLSSQSPGNTIPSEPRRPQTLGDALLRRSPHRTQTRQTDTATPPKDVRDDPIGEAPVAGRVNGVAMFGNSTSTKLSADESSILSIGGRTSMRVAVSSGDDDMNVVWTTSHLRDGPRRQGRYRHCSSTPSNRSTVRSSSIADRSSRVRRSGSARMSISTTFPPAIVKPSTLNRRPSGRCGGVRSTWRDHERNYRELRLWGRRIDLSREGRSTGSRRRGRRKTFGRNCSATVF